MKNKIILIDILILIILTFVYYLVIYHAATDIPAHALILKNYLIGTTALPTNFGYYLTIYFFSFFSKNLEILIKSSFFVLVGITFVKYLITKKIFASQIKIYNQETSLKITITSIMLLFCFSLPSVYIYFGKFYINSYPPNVWHNSTTIFAMPFVVLLFWQSLKQLEIYSFKREIILLLLIILNILIKPSFIFVYIIAYPIMLLLTYGINKIFFRSLIALVAAGLLIFIEYYFIYYQNNSNQAKTTIAVDFLHILHKASKQNWFFTAVFFVSTFISSFLFPIICLLKNKHFLKEKMIQYSLICSLLALIISSFLYESGSRELSGNFFWQNFMCTYLLFMVCLVKLLEVIIVENLDYKAYKIEIGFFTLHFIAGVVYLIKIVVTGTII